MKRQVVEVRTGQELVTEVTAIVESFCEHLGEGLVHLFVPHATAGLALMETGSGSEDDLEDALERLVPRGADYRHRHGSKGHGGDHVLPAFVSPFMVLAVQRGRPELGTWQRVVVVDPNVDNHTRSLVLSFLEDSAS